MDANVLERAGLTKSEIKIFLALNILGEVTSGPLIKKVQLNSSRVYESLASLERKGLVSFVKKSHKRYFRASQPKRLLDYIEEKKRKLNDDKENIVLMLPELEACRKRSNEEEQEATIYQGFKGYKTLLRNMLDELTPHGSYIAIASGMFKNIIGPYWHIFQQEKRRRNITSRLLWDRRILEQRDYLHEYYGNGRIIAHGSYLSPVDVWVYRDNVILVSYITKPIFAILVRSAGLAQSYRDLFEILWKNGKVAHIADKRSNKKR